MQNRPVVLRGYGGDWTATEKWTEKGYLEKLAGFTKAGIYTINIDDEEEGGEKPKFQPKKIEMSLTHSLKQIAENPETRKGKVL